MLYTMESNQPCPDAGLREFSDSGESLEWRMQIAPGQHSDSSGKTVWERWHSFLPDFLIKTPRLSLGEGDTPLIQAPEKLCSFTGIKDFWLKMETANPTCSFKDRGSRAAASLSLSLGESCLAVISTGNMGHSTAAYGAMAGMPVLIFVPRFIPAEKTIAARMHGATIVRIDSDDYSELKSILLDEAPKLGIRITSGNNPFRIEGYKTGAFELFEQCKEKLPDWVAVPTSACGHIRGLFKGFQELFHAGLISQIPGMILVQPGGNSPVATAVRRCLDRIIPVAESRTIATALSSSDPPGGNEIVRMAKKFHWLASIVDENEILPARSMMSLSGILSETSAALTIPALKSLKIENKISPNDRVVMMVTGSGLKESLHCHEIPGRMIDCPIHEVRGILKETGSVL